jgi:uncharacterized protein (DUF4415 family)
MAAPHKAPHAPGYVQNPHYTQEDWDEVSNAPESTDAELARAKPFAEVFPDLAKSIARRGPQKAPTKVPVSIRLAPDVLAALKATGPGWQSRVSELLRKALRAPRAKRTTRRKNHQITAPARRA